ncbi:cofactor assembly of complex C subunit B [Ancylothrix sp. C2]|uniref:cofactor assembly of complex C subunit B n=1 Tax=Ancylothrix sp. D3o TaxID=2953691 RepID=UPI0021BB7BC1|nr:cofactor assembly of complex C subunit B [Ancylothrix sp. D3o]MCT7949141.1 cofactor assembly of complex C subunit B [Ancylothrix sp. D3o]
MTPAILSSTFLLTLLLGVGLFFFIRASVKDRTEEVKLISDQAVDSVLTQLQEYFSRRAYRMAAIDGLANQVTFEGYVRPSWFLAVFLSLLAAVGILCLALVLAILLPQVGFACLALLLLAPAAGWFYWRRAGRKEQVSLKVEILTPPSPAANGGFTQMPVTSQNIDEPAPTCITIKAHRDEIAELTKTFPFKSGHLA